MLMAPQPIFPDDFTQWFHFILILKRVGDNTNTCRIPVLKDKSNSLPAHLLRPCQKGRHGRHCRKGLAHSQILQAPQKDTRLMISKVSTRSQGCNPLKSFSKLSTKAQGSFLFPNQAGRWIEMGLGNQYRPGITGVARPLQTEGRYPKMADLETGL